MGNEILDKKFHVNLIAAVGSSGQIGFQDQIPWYDSEDLMFFRRMAENQILIMGKHTGAPLKPILEKSGNRYVHIMTRDETPESIIKYYRDTEKRKSIWICGGETIYKIWMPFITRSFISHISYDGEADTWMPDLWKCLKE